MGTPQLTCILHPFIGVVMFALFIIMLLRCWHHDLINRDDIFWVRNIRKIVINEEVDDTGHYNFNQKRVFWAAIIFPVLLLMSGVIIWRPYSAPAFSIPMVRFALTLHSFAMAALIVVIMVHIYVALGVRGTITTMVEGWVTSAWVEEHHSRRYRGVRKTTEKKTEGVFA